MTTSLALQHFAILDIVYYQGPSSIFITINTNNPCHLTCYFTTKAPVRHRTTLFRRGLNFPWGAYWCFVAWNTTPQLEPGDTLIHTFEVSPWYPLTGKWFAFRGTVAGDTSPSVSPIIRHFHSGVYPATKFESYEVNWDHRRGIIASFPSAQSFTPQQLHLISSVILLLSRSVPTWPTLYIDIQTAPDDIPTGPVLTSGSISAVELTVDPLGSWVEIPLTRYKLSPTTKYTIVATSDADSFARLFWHLDITAATYPRGIHSYFGDVPPRWIKVPDADLMFQEWGYS